jgi:hypothetical protein
MREAKELLAQRSELLHSDGPPATDAVRATWKRLDELATAAEQEFPLSASAVVNLRAELQRRVRAIHAAELAAHEALTAAVARWPETR